MALLLKVLEAVPESVPEAALEAASEERHNAKLLLPSLEFEHKDLFGRLLSTVTPLLEPAYRALRPLPPALTTEVGSAAGTHALSTCVLSSLCG
mmetsp:Transcript_83427/g.193925  ORF Transcript_83427/g.193925 Transcript_83427/m.193925 type:complete len:94 (+) Transcript_83427:567-848(+)